MKDDLLNDNENHHYSKLNKDDINDLLTRRASPVSLEKRLLNDFGLKKNSTLKKNSMKKKSMKKKKKSTLRKKSMKK
jgi:hypothetical protein